MIECEECAATGYLANSCGYCDFKGWVHDERDGGTMECPECRDGPCPECHGEGYI